MIGVYVHHIWFCLTIINLSGDIEEKPGPKRNSNQSFSICHWNLNSIIPHNYIKVSLLRAYISLHNFSVVYQGHILTLPQHLMIKILKLLDITY